MALTTDILCASRLAAGTLCRPLPQRFRMAGTYHFVCLPQRADEPAIKAFREWLAERLPADASGASTAAK